MRYRIIRATQDVLVVKNRQQGRSSALDIFIQDLCHLIMPCESLETLPIFFVKEGFEGVIRR